MSKKQPIHTPDWHEGQIPANSWRSLFRWGDPAAHKHPNPRLYNLMKSTFHLQDSDFENPILGLETMNTELPVGLPADKVAALEAIVGEENIHSDTYTRIKASYGKGLIDALRLRQHIVENLPDVVVHPRNREDVEKIVTFCNEERIPLYVFGGGSTVTRGMEAVKGGITIDMSIHMNRVIEFNEENHTITVEAGMWGPQLENTLQNAPQTLQAQRAYTTGHFPQSFEFSSVGGWVVTRGAGQNSTYYGKIEDIVVAQEYVTPRGVIRSGEFPRQATGPDLDQIMMGSEGSFGVLTSATLKVHHWMPENRKRFSYMFKNWDDARNAAREIMQGEFGYPSVFRLSDPEETNVAMKLYKVEDTIADSLLKNLGYQPMQKCLLLGFTDGEKTFCKNLNHKIRQTARKYGAFKLSAFGVTQAWEHSRFSDPYMREDLMDHGIMIDTLECAVTWSQMKEVHARVRQVVKNRPDTICMTHLSHAYPQGANLYWIFIAKIDKIQEYLDLQYSVLQTILESGAAMSHHHGVGKQTSPWLEEQMGTPYMDIVRTLKRHFDPNNILNPGGTLGLDMNDAQKNKIWSKDL